MQFTSYLDDGTLTVALTGEIDHHSAKGYFDAIACKIEVYNPRICDLDFGDVAFMDSSGLGLILGRYNKAKAVGAEFEIVNPGEKIMRIMYRRGYCISKCRK